MPGFSLGSFIASLEGGYDHELHTSRSLTVNDVRRIAAAACESFRNSSLDLFSCFELEGEFGLWSTIENSIKNNPISAELIQAEQAGDAAALGRVLQRDLKLGFIALFQKGALRRLQLVDELPPEAQRDLQKLQDVINPPAPVPTAAELERQRLAEYVAFSNDPKTSMEKIKDRTRKDPGFAQWYKLQYTVRGQAAGRL